MADAKVHQTTQWRPTTRWQWLVVIPLGGLYHIGKLWFCIHDRGFWMAWVVDSVERWRIGR